ncbi:MAG: class I SAM-dependent methyltransferase [Thermoplasmata archaeon]
MSGRRSHPHVAGAPYSLTARVYDEIYAWKDYEAEARRVRRLIREYGLPHSKTLLDVACGTGAHLRYLSRWFDATGLDSSAGMLREARKSLPHVRFVRRRMEEFDLRMRFDAITCLFSAIGYVKNVRELRRTVRNFAAHLTPGGVAIVEPWLTSRTYRAGSLHLQSFGSVALPIARMSLSEQHGNRSVLDMHHLVGTPEGVRHWVEHHGMGLFEVPTYLAAFRAAGFRPRFIRRGLMKDRGLYVAVLGGDPGRPVRGAPRPRKGNATRRRWSSRPARGS